MQESSGERTKGGNEWRKERKESERGWREERRERETVTRGRERERMRNRDRLYTCNIVKLLNKRLGKKKRKCHLSENLFKNPHYLSRITTIPVVNFHIDY